MHLMIDLETLSTLPDAPIIQIGVVYFPLPGRGVSSLGRWNVDPQSAFDLGLRPRWDTVKFWMSQAQQRTAAADEIMDGADTYHLADALLDLANRFRALGADTVWSHGAGFDLPILRTAYAAICEETPWGYRQERCTRTLFALAELMRPGWASEFPEAAHDALVDARQQALKVQAAMEVIQPW